jgi:putative N6-adenine-specific DNA methylase
VPLFAGDVSFRMTDFAARNAQRAGVQDGRGRPSSSRRPTRCSARRRPSAARCCSIPPYGERIEPKGSRVARGAASAPREGFEGGAADFFGRLARTGSAATPAGPPGC